MTKYELHSKKLGKNRCLFYTSFYDMNIATEYIKAEPRNVKAIWYPTDTYGKVLNWVYEPTSGY